ncbi:MAG: DNA polymerase III subunit delta [Treponema sp.]|nr:DNA polymerase III subunit delta [Candidatus Treponema equifaecale]
MAAPIYLYTGPELGERNDQVEAVKQALKKQFGDSDDYLLYASDTKIEEVIAKLQTESLFVPATCVVLREAEAIKKKEEVELISSWLKTVSSKPKETQNSATLILVSDEISVDTKLDKLVPKENKKIFWELAGYRLEEWVRNYFRKNGYGIDGNAVESILDMLEGNTESLKMECSRFFLCFPKGHLITEDDVEQMLSHNREETAFSLFDAISDNSQSPSKRLENGLQILDKILLSKASNSISLMAGLTSCFRKLQLWHSIHNGNYNPDLKSNGFTSKKAIAQYTRASQIWNYGQTAAVLSMLSQTDMDIRSTGQALQKTQLSMLLYSIVMRGGAKLAVYDTDLQ